MKTFEKLAMEVAKALRQDDLVASLELCTRFLAAVDAERGKDAVGYIDSAQLKRWETLRGTDFEVAERCYIPWSAIPFKSDISDCSTPVFLSPTIPEGMALVPTEPTEAILDALFDPETDGDSLNEVDAYKAMIQAAGVTK